MRRLRKLLPALLAFPLCSFGWWALGHQVVARIAGAHLTPAARTRIARILEVADTPEAVADAMAVAATWADETKVQTRTANWHFVNLTIEDAEADIAKRCTGGDCAPERVKSFAAELRLHRPDQRWSELDQLRYLIHLTGDLHQPLHTISDADLGGNCEILNPAVDKANNLHALWDGGIAAAMDLDDRTLAESLESDAVSMGTAKQEQITSGTVNSWTWEAHELGIRDIYERLHIPTEPVLFPKSCGDAPEAIQNFHLAAGDAYVDAMKPAVRDQLLKAGLRLAKLLNESM